jgi:restriction endonuclease Mrr
LSAIGLSLPAAKDSPRPQRKDEIRKQDGVNEPIPPAAMSQNSSRLDIARLKTLGGLLSLTPREFERAVMMMLRAHGYHHVSPSSVHAPSDIACGSPDGHRVYVWCKLYTPKTLVTSAQVLSAIGAASQDHRRAMIITTSGFTGHAQSEAKAHSDRISLIDGQLLVEMMQHVQPE